MVSGKRESPAQKHSSKRTKCKRHTGPPKDGDPIRGDETFPSCPRVAAPPSQVSTHSSTSAASTMLTERRSHRLDPGRHRRKLISLILGSKDHEDDYLEARRPSPRRRARARKCIGVAPMRVPRVPTPRSSTPSSCCPECRAAPPSERKHLRPHWRYVAERSPFSPRRRKAAAQPP